MPDITDPQAIRFCNEVARPIAEVYASLYYDAKRFADIWTAQGISAIIPNTADLIIDGRTAEGVSQLTGAMVNGLKSNLDALIADLEASSGLKRNALLKIAVRVK